MNDKLLFVVTEFTCFRVHLSKTTTLLLKRLTRNDYELCYRDSSIKLLNLKRNLSEVNDSSLEVKGSNFRKFEMVRLL